MADVKTLLKEARKLVDEKKFEEAQVCCKNILRKDKQNYLGLVLLGKSLQDTEQAPLAYQKAIASKPDHPLAWQGLAGYYERNDDNAVKTKLFKIYDEILKLSIEEEKAIEIVTKLGQLGCLLKNSYAISTLAVYIKKTNVSQLRSAAQKQLTELIKADVPCLDDNIPATVGILEDMYEDTPSEMLELLIGKTLMQNTNFKSAVESVINLSFFTQNVVLREELCKYLCRKYIEQDSFENFELIPNLDKITKGIENSKYPSLLQSIIFYYQGLYLDAYKICVPLVNYQQADVTECKLVIKCAMKLMKWSAVQKLVNNLITKVKDTDFSLELRKFLFIALAKQNKWQQAIESLKDNHKMLNKEETALYAECHIELDLPVEHIFNCLQGSEYLKQLEALLFLKQKKFEEVVNLLENNELNAISLFYLGKAYWNLKDYDKCHVTLLKAAKLDAEHAETFLYLGHLYKTKNGLEKARKCFEKAYSLNSSNNEILKSLSEIYIILDLEDLDFSLLSAAEKNIQTLDTWIYFRLGLHYLKKKNWENAVINFRNVIKSNPNNTIAFECLADAYYCRGSYSSALRAYQKVITMDSKRAPHCYTRKGYIHSLLTQYNEAISAFEKVLQIDTSSVIALKGMAETWVKIAKKKNIAKLYGSARECAQQAVNFLTKALSKQRQYSCLWKLLADVLIFITKLPEKFVYVFIGQSIIDINFKLVRKDKPEIFQQAIACYSYVTKLKQQTTSYDLALAYFSYFLETKELTYCNISFNLAIACLKEKTLYWRNWNLLGRICLFIKKYDIAQHCFIKALLTTRKWSIANIWCNLGTLYVKLKLYKLSNYCFWRGQSTSPSYPHSWIGQGLIAEAVREEEAMDLFRHASRLGYHSESALGYADWVCRTLKSYTFKNTQESKYVIDGLFAIQYSVDLIEWLTTYEPQNACALTILGILQERCGLLRAAFTSYEKAYKYAEESKKNIALLNLGRILLRLEKYDEAVSTYKTITEASFDSTSGLALALFKQGQYEESYSVYNTALDWLSNDDGEKADLLVAMAGIMYMFKGPDDAKTLLFHSIQLTQKKPTAYSLFAICSLGLIHSDQNLSKLALSELKKYEFDYDFAFDIGLLKSYAFACDDNLDQAIKSLSDTIHDHPNNSNLWFLMAQYCLLGVNVQAPIASCCAQRALCSAFSTCSLYSAKMLATASIAECSAGDCSKATLLAKTGLHMYPYKSEIWAALLFSLLSEKKWMDKKEWVLNVAGYMRRNLDIARNLSRWVSLLERKINK